MKFIKEKTIIYQLFFRMITPEGTIKAAEKLLPHIASTGVNMVYLCPVCEEDADERQEYWSNRQVKSGLGNPKNPYRIKDYFEVDEEYGTKQDLKDFVNKAHELGLGVMFDLVYYHVGITAKMIDLNPEFVERDENGEVKIGGWRFPVLNYKSKALREYMTSIMKYYLSEYNVDGFRCDVAGCVTFDYWKEAIEEIRAIKPDIMMLSEGGEQSWLNCGSFDINYTRIMSVMLHAEGSHAKEIREFNKSMDGYNRNAKGEYENNLILPFETHDSVTDSGMTDGCFPADLADAALFYDFTANGTPFLYNGNEIANANKNSMFANRQYGRDNVVDWSWAVTKRGQDRLQLVRTLCNIRLSENALCFGTMEWIDNESEDALLYVRAFGGVKITVAINLSENEYTIPEENAKGKVLISKYYQSETHKLGAYGYVLVKG